MSSPEENLMDWLRDAHAMEEQAEKMLEATAARVKNYPVLKEKLLVHLEETRGQARLVRGCIERRGGDTSTIKDLAAKATAMVQGLSGTFVEDEIVKASMASYTFEHFEIASYRTLIAAAEALGDVETQRVCEGILKEEEAMAAWLEQQLPVVAKMFFARTDAGVEAKR
jgi:ferritin-like metal-binding protein YciE